MLCYQTLFRKLAHAVRAAKIEPENLKMTWMKNFAMKEVNEVFIQFYEVFIYTVLPSFFTFFFLHWCGCGSKFLSISMIACRTGLIFQE